MQLKAVIEANTNIASADQLLTFEVPGAVGTPAAEARSTPMELDEGSGRTLGSYGIVSMSPLVCEFRREVCSCAHMTVRSREAKTEELPY